MLAVLYLPALAPEAGSLADFTPRDTPAIATEARSARIFGQPISRVAVVQRDPAGLSPAAQRETVAAAVDLTQQPRGGLLGALPLVNDPRIWPQGDEQATTAVTYLYFAPETSWREQVDLARAYAAQRLTQADASVVGVTGSVPARVAQEDAIAERLGAVEIATVVLVALILGVTFGSLLAPLVTLLAAGVAYVIGSRLVALAGRELGLTPPSEIDPLVVVLLLGIVADYAIFYLSGARERLGRGGRRGEAVRDTTAQLTPIILTAGLMVAAGTAALLAATQATFRSFGPGLAISVLAGLVVSVTFIPAAMATFGRALYWPRGLRASKSPTTPSAPAGWRGSGSGSPIWPPTAPPRWAPSSSASRSCWSPPPACAGSASAWTSSAACRPRASRGRPPRRPRPASPRASSPPPRSSCRSPGWGRRRSSSPHSRRPSRGSRASPPSWARGSSRRTRASRSPWRPT